MNWHQHIAVILEQEPELWLDYLTGKRLAGDLPMLKKKRFGIPGFSLNTVWFVFWVVGKWSPASQLASEPEKKTDFLVLATSRNQINSTSSTISALRHDGKNVLALSKKKRLKASDDHKLYEPITHSAGDIVRALIGYRAHGRALYKRLKEHKTQKAERYFPEIAKVYLYLAYFFRVLSEAAPRYVITSNDHSALNRCMLAVAHHLDIKTVYIQHASVSTAFPALLFDYAFLDGPAAADIYQQCSENRPATLKRQVKTRIIYSGQKKSLTRRSAPTCDRVGIAVNKLDDMDSVIRLTQLLKKQGVNLVIRWHPRQSQHDIRRLQRQAGENSKLSLSNPEHESINDFLNNVGWLVAGNSSIHLEAAIKGVAPIYFEFSRTDISDYYGYARRGLAKWVKSEEELIALLVSDAAPEVNEEAVRFYSSTFGTEWEGREGELVAKHLSSESSTHIQTD